MKKRSGSILTMMQYPNIVALIITILVLFGVFALVKINKQEFPEFTIRQGVIVGVYPGASAKEVEEQLTKPLEKYLFGFEEIDKKHTVSYSQNDMVFIFAELSKKVHDKDAAWSKIKHGLNIFKQSLPPGVLAVIVNDDFGNASSILLSLASDTKSYRDLENYYDLLCNNLRTIDATGKLNIYGSQNEEINIYLDQEKLSNFGIDTKTISLKLFSQDLTTFGAQINNNQINIPVRVNSPYTTEEAIGEEIIFVDLKGNTVKLKDVATIKREYPPPSSYVTYNGKNTLILSIEMRSGNNIVRFGNEVDKILDDFTKILPDDVELTKITDMPKVIDESVIGFLIDLVKAIVVVILVMLLLFPFRSAVVAAIGIPISTAITIGFMYISGMELNTVTLAALMLVLGMIVDNSIVVIDGYTENLRVGYSPWDAAYLSAKTYSSSLFIATFAISIMFYPYLFTLTGVFQDFVKFFPLTITIALFSSLGLALYMIPYLEYKLIKPIPKDKKPKGFAKVQEKFFTFIQNTYEKVLTFCFKIPYTTLLFAIGTIILGIVIFINLPVQMMPYAERDMFAVEIYLPRGSTLDQTEIVSDRMENILLADERVVSVTAFKGTSSPRFMNTYAPNLPGSNYAQFIVNTTTLETCVDVINDYGNKYMDYFPNAYVRFKQLDYQTIKTPIEIQVYGNDITEVKNYSDTIFNYLNSLKGKLTWIHTDYDGTIPTAEIFLDRNMASKLGVSKTSLSLNLATNYSGLPITTIYEDDYGIPVKLRTTSENSDLFTQLQNQLISTSIPGVQVPLRQIAKIEPKWEPSQIAHRNGINCITINADIAFGNNKAIVASEVNKYIKKNIEPNFPSDIKIKYGGVKEENSSIIPEVLRGSVLALLVMFLFLLFSFKKIGISLLSIAAIALCFFGSFFGLWITNLDFGFTSILGLVTLVGIIVRNSIIMFEYAENLRNEQGMSAKETAFEAGKRRMRPIFLTSATTSFGVLPMMLGNSTLWKSMGIVIFFGVFLSIGFIVTILPIAYWKIVKDPKDKQGKTKRNIFKNLKKGRRKNNLEVEKV